MSDISISNGSINYVEDNKWNKKGEFYLPHSCDEWVIGDIEDARAFLADLEKTIKEVESAKQIKD